MVLLQPHALFGSDPTEKKAKKANTLEVWQLMNLARLQ
jgi:hypothetical protein